VPDYHATVGGCQLIFIDDYFRSPEGLVKYSIQNLVRG